MQENKAFGMLFEPKKEVTCDMRKINNKELHSFLYYSYRQYLYFQIQHWSNQRTAVY
jgi:hypothetical protein